MFWILRTKANNDAHDDLNMTYQSGRTAN